MATPDDEAFWDQVGDYDKEIISIFKDAKAAEPLISQINSRIGPDTLVADIGTGPGNLLPYLSEARKVYAVDRSLNMLEQARRKPVSNVEFVQADIRERALPEPVNLLISVSSFLPKSFTDGTRLLEAMAGQLKPGGTLLMLVPSFESRLYHSNLRLAYLIESEGWSEPDAYRQLTAWHARYMNNMFGYIQGKSDRPIQKFWVREEIEERIESISSLDLRNTVKFEKPWDIYFPREPGWFRSKPPRWMWMLDASRRQDN